MRIDNSMWESVFDNAIKGIESEKAEAKKQKDKLKSSASEIIELVQDEELKKVMSKMISSSGSKTIKDFAAIIKKIRSSIKEKLVEEMGKKKNGIRKHDEFADEAKKEKIKNDGVVDTKPFYNKNLFLYLLYNDNWNCFKIGVSGDIDKRLEMHSMNGFKLIESMKRTDAREVERKIIIAIRSMGIRMGRNLFENQFDGWNECWHKDELSVECIDDLLGLVDRNHNREEQE